ncbi:uncharacterized protein MEPE_03879 [Melanopsichium pennsylvanicum]|uniref:Uncharacterized protein n=2 Tax=Melanopsichium pennsylvanicum TaxID=63383 RepID=A0AAJ5C5V9_9BASI|nr:putative protein [Melanopsichium pennsylvanicum 4]SNX85170.1 uncharacterized protein MEPE_03879 [Melanopsichium pennsylvanicum]
MKFSLAPIALLAAFAASGAVAQDSSVSSASGSSSMMSSSSASSSMSSSSSAAQPTSMSSSAGGESSGEVCTVLGGDPRAQPAACHYSSTSTPPYNLSSLISYFIYGYTRGPEGKSPEDVANEMAGSVLQYYPTLTTPKSDLQKSFAEAISATIHAIADGTLQASDLAPAGRAVPEHLLQYGVAAAAIVAAGAFAL